MNYSIVCKRTVADLQMLGKILNSIVVTDDHGQTFSLSEASLLRPRWRKVSPKRTNRALTDDFFISSGCPRRISFTGLPSITRVAVGPGSSRLTVIFLSAGTTIDLTGWRGAMRVRAKTSRGVSRTGPPAENEWAVEPVGLATMNPSAVALMIRLRL